MSARTSVRVGWRRAGLIPAVAALLLTVGCGASWEATAVDYAREAGFTYCAPKGEAFAPGTGTQPVRVYRVRDERGAGVSVDYDRFQLREYKTDGVLKAADLEPYVAVAVWAEKGISPSGGLQEHTVLGRPALTAPNGLSGVVVFQPADGVVARLEPWGRVPPGRSTPERPMPLTEALKVAETFSPR